VERVEDSCFGHGVGLTDYASKVFISYSHEDVRWRDLLASQLGVLEHEDRLMVWHNGHIKPGANWLPEIELAMAQARVAILLISADFLHSEFIRRHEVRVLLERRQRQGLWVIPVIARPCPWHQVEWLLDLRARSPDGRTAEAETEISSLADEVLELIADGTGETPLIPASPTRSLEPSEAGATSPA